MACHRRIRERGPALGAPLFDDSATSVCGGLPASVAGQGSTAGDTLTMTGVLTCRPGGNPLRFRITVEFVYSPGSDTLADSFGVIWQRT